MRRPVSEASKGSRDPISPDVDLEMSMRSGQHLVNSRDPPDGPGQSSPTVSEHEEQNSEDPDSVGSYTALYSKLIESSKFGYQQIVAVHNQITWAVMHQFMLERLPVVEWLPKYTTNKFLKDLQAGLVVGCMLIPQGMGYADLAGLPYVAGLYSGFAPLLAYWPVGTSRQMGIGPVAIVSLLVAKGVPACNKLCQNPDGSFPPNTWPSCPLDCDEPAYNPEYWSYATCIALMSGIIQVIFAPFLGFVMNFVPHPVISGFTSAGGLIIALSQLKDIMSYPIAKGRLQNGIWDFFSQLNQTHGLTCIMGVVAIVFLFFIRKLGQGKVIFFPKIKVSPKAKLAAKLPWAFVLVVLYIMVTWLLRLDKEGVKITGQVPSGLPPFVMPAKFFEAFPKLISITIQIVIIGYLESIAVETKFATMLKYQVRPTQEAVAQGFANIIGGLTSAYPVVGSFSRSAVNANYESQSTTCNLITGFVIMFTLLFLTQCFYFLPKNCLAAIVIVAALSLVDPSEAIFLLQSSTKEFFLLLITFCLTAFVALEMGIYVAIGLCGAEVLFKSTRPKVAVLSENYLLVFLPGASGMGKKDTMAGEMMPKNLDGRDILVVRVEGDLNFSGSSALQKIVSDYFNKAKDKKKLTAMVFDLAEMDILDSTALHALIALVEEFEGHNIAVFTAGMPPGLVHFMKMDSVKDKFTHVTMGKSMQDVTQQYIPVVNSEMIVAEEHPHSDHDEPPRMARDNSKNNRYHQTLEGAVDFAIQIDEKVRRQGGATADYSRSDTLGSCGRCGLLLEDCIC